MKLKLYKLPTCPKCRVLCMKLDSKNLQYEVSTDLDEMEAFGIQSVPVLMVDDDRYNFEQAIKWVNGVDSEH